MTEYNPALPNAPERNAVKFTEKDKEQARQYQQPGVRVSPYFCELNTDPFKQVKWETRTAEIKNPTTGETVFRKEGLEFPDTWSENCTALVAEKYFRHVEFEHTNGVTTVEKRQETSVKEMISRVANTIAQWGCELGYFPTPEGDENTTWKLSVPAKVFRDELISILLHQRASFNSPVWFNVGTKRGILGTEQASACFINSVEDTMPSILKLAQTEGDLYKGGSGSGVNYSPLRSSRESLSIGGTSSGPVPFIYKDDINAGAIKSGGGTRRAAKMAILNVDHGDIVEFIKCKAHSEKAAHALIDAGFDGDFRARWGAYQMLPFQNANHSVRVTDEFMEAVEKDEDWDLIARDGTTVLETLPAQDIWKDICKAAWVCGDPGLQFDTTINKWHTSKDGGRINSSNPCCFVGETLVETSEGRIRIDELQRMSDAGEVLPLAFAWDEETNLPVLRQIKKAWKAGEVNELIRVKTDKGVVLECTPEHRFLLRNGEWVEAQNLQDGMRLRKIGRWANEKRSSRWHINHRATPSTPNGTVIQARWMWEQVHGPIPPGMHVHHKNENPTDDKLSNLGLEDRLEHITEHSKGANNARFMEIRPEVLVEVYEAIESTPRTRHKKQPPVTPARWNGYVNRMDLKGKIPLAGTPTYGGRIQGMTWAQFEEFIEEHRNDVNDYVVEVSSLVNYQPLLPEPIPAPVFDIEIEGVHNFSVACEEADHGIIVHNSEFMYLDDTACNLASINLLKFQHEDGMLHVKDFQQTVDVMITAMEILVDGASYPTEQIRQNSHDYRPLGLGFTNLGAYFMSQGISYDSDEAREQAGFISSLMSARAYRQSAKIASEVGPFSAFPFNRGHMLKVVKMHADANDTAWSVSARSTSSYKIWYASVEDWVGAVSLGEEHGYRNGQATVIAPTGTISFMMDCDTTGIEPVLNLVTYKKLVGGGTIKMVNQRVGDALAALDYPLDVITVVENYILENGSIVGCQDIRPDHYEIFDGSFPEPVEGRSLRPEAHILMMAAVQPFISGAISKTCNLPNDATEEDIASIYSLAWEKGLKSIALYRDGCKRTQPLETKEENPKKDKNEILEEFEQSAQTPVRRKLPRDCMSYRHKFEIGQHEGYIHVGLYEDGHPGEIFIKMAKEGSTVSGLMDAWGIQTSMSLQYGVPLKSVVQKFKHTSFEPSGWTKEPGIEHASSVLDYVARWLEKKFFTPVEFTTPAAPEFSEVEKPKLQSYSTGMGCPDCGNTTVKTGACATCPVCGWNQGCG